MSYEQPNIVMIMADQFTAGAIGAMGHPAVKTPHLDQLVENGVSFENAYCNSPLCAPSRASFVSGKHVSDIKVYDNGAELSADTPTFLHHLRKAGYETVLSGKMHFVGPDQMHGFEHRLLGDLQTASFDLTPDWTKGVYHNEGTGVRRLTGSNISEVSSQLNYDEKVLHRTLEYIRKFKHSKEEKPFFLCSSFFHPHDPFRVPKKYWDMYDDISIPLPNASKEDIEHMHPYNQWIQKHHEIDICELTDEEIKENRRAYYAMITYMDDKVGAIMAELERLQMMDDTIIIFTSDHGEMLGEHGMWFKRTFFDPATKIPLIITNPSRFSKGKTVNEVVSLVDLTATLMDIANISDQDYWCSTISGDSLMNLLTGQAEDWKDEAICEYYGEGPIQPMLMLRSGRYKYVYVHEHDPLLFDLEKDPYETENLAKFTEYQTILTDFETRIKNEFDMEKIKKDIMQSQQERLLISEALRIGKKTSWDLN